jgi:hypothetical protein
VRLEDALRTAIELYDGSELIAEDLVVRGTRRRELGDFPPDGLRVLATTRLTLLRGLLEDNAGTDLLVEEGTVHLTDVRFRQFEEFGLRAERSDVALNRVAIAEGRGVGISLDETVASASNVSIHDLGPVTESCGGRRCVGIGVHVEESPSDQPFRMDEFEISQCDDSAIMLFTAGEADLRDGLISHNVVAGARLLERPEELRRLMVRVRYHDNPQAISFE